MESIDYFPDRDIACADDLDLPHAKERELAEEKRAPKWRAEEQRTAVGTATKEYSNASLGGPAGYAVLLGDNYLLDDHWESYAHARDSLAQVRMQDFQMDKWLFER